ncbi:sensor histidine kinase [Ruminococcus sp. 5_1_39BFAA]|uniref:cache domain-containing sensor histidine kinase n=1 Tax=Ruminococcus sp. 5_1_39BFAA TaxID=457412 RepID=UPI0035634841
MKDRKEKSLKSRAMQQIALLIAIAMMAAIGMFYFLSRERTINEQKLYEKEHVSNVMSYLSDYIDEVDAVAKSTNYNYYLQDYLVEALKTERNSGDTTGIENMVEYEMSSRAFSDILLTRPDVSNIMVFGRKTLLFYKTLYTYRNVIVDYSLQEWYRKAMEDPQKAAVTGPNQHFFFSMSNEPTLSISRVVQNCQDGSFLGVILIDVNMNEIAKICESIQSGDDQGSLMCILNEKGEIVYEQQDGKNVLGLDGEENKEILNSSIESADDDSFRITLNNVDYFATKGEMEKANWTVLTLKPYRDVMSSLNSTIMVMIFAVAATLLLTLLVLNGILAGVIGPLKKLQVHMERVNIENLNHPVPIQSNDEIGKLSQNFNEMLERIENLKEQVVEEQENKRRYELQALQAQINPHFLYNTLDSIIWMAETNDKNIVPMTEALAKLFRISLNKGNEEITLKKELEHVKNYLIIQNMRYADKFTYEINMEPEVEKCRIIKLILQPIVENSIYHGIKLKKGSGHIRIDAFREEDFLKIKISDDGCGMTQEMCDKILSDEIEPENISGSGIGVRNVNERIMLRFGEGYGLKYYGELGKGTTVVYTLPFELEGL